MLRRVGFARKQQLEYHAVSFFGPHQPSIQKRCTTAAVLHRRQEPIHSALPRHIPTTAFGTATIPLRVSPPGNCGQSQVSAKSPFIPSEIVAAASQLLESHGNEKVILRTIQASPVLLKHFTGSKSARELAEAMALSPAPHLSYRVLHIAHKLRCKFKQNAYECVAYQLALTQHWRTVLSIVSLGRRHTGRTSSRLLNWRARALLETQHYGELQNVLKEFKNCQILPTRRTYHIILSGHIRSHNLAQAKACLRLMEEAGFPPDASSNAIVARTYRSLGADPEVQHRALASLPSLTNSTAAAVINSLIRLHLDTGDVRAALLLLPLFHPEAVSAIRSVMSTTVEDICAPYPPAPRNPPIPPNAATFSIFINYLANKADLPGALQIYLGMMNCGINPTTGTIAALMSAYFAANQPDVAVRLLADICNQEKTPIDVFQPLLTVPTSVRPTLPTASVPLTAQLFNILLRGVMPIHGLKCVSTILHIMKANDISINPSTLGVLLDYLAKVEKVHPKALLRILRKLSSHLIRPTLRNLHPIVNGLIIRNRYLLYGRGWNDTAAKISYNRIPFNRGTESRLPTATRTFDPIAGLTPPMPYQSLLRPFVNSLTSRQIKSDGAMIGMRIRYDAVIQADLESAQNIFNTLLVRGMHPNEYHFSALMEGFTQAGNIEGAIDVMKLAERFRVKPNVVMFTILIVGHARQGNPDQSLRVFQDMVAHGIRPDVPAIDATSSAFFAVGAHRMARRILMILWPHIQAFPKEFRFLPLKELARRFRLLHKGSSQVQTMLTKPQRLELHWRLKSLAAVWHAHIGSTIYTSRGKRVRSTLLK
ncbi:hypothetical protein BD779DRAFT_1431817 [Infundibulicybe gibba]|nr:hypothetical protein BD779DRAFT_1431817 [Infundibulicybe gibba]